MRWTVVELGLEVRCGGCGTRIAVDEPVLLLINGKQQRCVACAGYMRFDVNHEQVASERKRIERALIVKEQQVEERQAEAPRYYQASRMTPVSQLLPGVLDVRDGKAAAAGDE